MIQLLMTLSVLAVISAPEALVAQRPLNLGFERPSVDGIARPWGWSATRLPSGIGLQLDETVSREGAFSLRIRRSGGETDANSHDVLRLHIPPRFAWGHEVALRGWVRSADADGGRVRLEVWELGRVVDVDSTAWSSGTADWASFELRLTVDSSAMYVVIIPEFRGSGTVWFDDLTIEVAGQRYDAVPVASTPTDADVAWLSGQTTTIETVDVSAESNQDYSDLESFASMVGDAKIIALGEDTHGTSEFFRAKYRLTRYMVEQMGARVFAIEANQLAVRRINEYVLGAPGDAREVMRVMFRVWNTAEMLAMIEWMRQHNLDHPEQRVEFVGYDMQDPSLPIDSIDAFLARVDPTLGDRVRPLYAAYREAWRRGPYPFGPDSLRKAWKQGADSGWVTLGQHRGEWLASAKSAADTANVDWALQNADVVRQAALSSVTFRLADRDSSMAVNIEWILARQPPSTRVVVWAHNAHVGRGTDPERGFYQGGSMGGFLSRRFGADLLVVGLVSYEGQYSATASFADRTEVAVNAVPGPIGTVEHALHQIAEQRNAGVLLADLRPARNDSAAAWLQEPRPTRLIGYAAFDFDWEQMVVLPHVFDALLFVDRATASQLLPRRSQEN